MSQTANDGERTQPLFALYASALAERALSAIAAGELAVWRFQETQRAVAVQFEGGVGAFPNLNTTNLAS